MNALSEHRKANHLSRSQLANLLEVDPVTVWRWENGKMRIPAERLADIESKTGIPRAELRPDIFGDAA